MSKTTRRTFVTLALGAVGVAAAGGAAWFGGLLGSSYPKTPYDDLLAKLPDREAAIVLGKAMRDQTSGFDATAMAASLRRRIANKTLKDVVIDDIDANGLSEVQGWVLPTSLAELSALAVSP
jgi:hypothetical protein